MTLTLSKLSRQAGELYRKCNPETNRPRLRSGDSIAVPDTNLNYATVGSNNWFNFCCNSTPMIDEHDYCENASIGSSCNDTTQPPNSSLGSTGDLERVYSSWDSPSKGLEISRTLQKASQLARYYTSATTPKLSQKSQEAISLIYESHWLISDLIDEGKEKNEVVRQNLNKFIVDKTKNIGMENPVTPVSANDILKNTNVDQQKAESIAEIINHIHENYRKVNDILKDKVSDSMKEWFYELYEDACVSLLNKSPDTRHKTSATGIYLVLKAAIMEEIGRAHV